MQWRRTRPQRSPVAAAAAGSTNTFAPGGWHGELSRQCTLAEASEAGVWPGVGVCSNT